MPKAKKQDKITHISRVVFEGYKSIDHLEIDLVKGLNIIIGPNGSGKSNFLATLKFVFDSFLEAPQSIVPYNAAEITMQTTLKKVITVFANKVKSKKKKDEVFTHLSNGFITKSELRIDNEIITQNLAYALIFHSKNIQLPELVFVKYNLPNYFTGIDSPGNIRFDKRSLSIKGIEQSFSFLNALIFNTLLFHYFDSASFKEIKLNKDEILEKLQFPESIIWDLQKFSPIQDVRFSPNINIYEDENRASIENIILEFYVNDNWVPWSYLSDGTKRLFYLISEISYFQDAIILIEEPELGVHPDQFFSIMTFLKEQAEYRQIIMSTHSPETLNVLDLEELQNIIMTKYDKKKGTTMTHLNKKQASKAKLYMKDVGFLSDYWLHSDMEE